MALSGIPYSLTFSNTTTARESNGDYGRRRARPLGGPGGIRARDGIDGGVHRLGGYGHVPRPVRAARASGDRQRIGALLFCVMCDPLVFVLSLVCFFFAPEKYVVYVVEDRLLLVLTVEQ